MPASFFSDWTGSNRSPYIDQNSLSQGMKGSSGSSFYSGWNGAVPIGATGDSAPLVQNPYSTSGAIDSVMQGVGKAGQFNDYARAMSLGYQATNIALAPFAAYHTASTVKKITNIQAEMIEMQAQSYFSTAERVLRAGEREAASISYKTGQAKASARVSMAAAGLQAGVGSTAEVMASYDFVKEAQINQVMYNRLTEAWGYRMQGVNIHNQALVKRYEAKSIKPWAAAISGGISAALQGFEMFGNMYGGGEGGGLNADTFKNFASSFKGMGK